MLPCEDYGCDGDHRPVRWLPFVRWTFSALEVLLVTVILSGSLFLLWDACRQAGWL